MDVHHNADPDIHEELLNYTCTQKDILTCMMCHIFFPSWLPHQRQALDCLQTRECFANLDLDASSAWWSNVSILPTAKGWQFHPALTNLGLICTQRPLPVPYALRTCCYTGEPWSSCNSYIQLNQNWNYCIPKNKTYSRYWLHRFVGALFGTPGSMGNVLSTYIEPHHISWHFSKTKFFWTMTLIYQIKTKTLVQTTWKNDHGCVMISPWYIVNLGLEIKWSLLLLSPLLDRCLMRGLETISIPSHVLAAWVWSALAVPLLDLGRAGIAKRFYKVMGHFIYIYIYIPGVLYIRLCCFGWGTCMCVCVICI